MTPPLEQHAVEAEANEQWREDMAWAEEHFGGEPLDPGIVRIVRIFKENGIETCQSCEGPKGMQPEGRHGVGHCYPCPTIDVTYQPWRALDIAMQYGVRVDNVSQVFRVESWRPVEHLWRVEFNSRDMARFRESWYERPDGPVPRPQRRRRERSS